MGQGCFSLKDLPEVDATGARLCELDSFRNLTETNAETAGARLDFRCGETSRASVEETRAERRTEHRTPEPRQAEELPQPARSSHLQTAGTQDQMRRVRRPHPPGDPHVQGRN